MGAVLALLLTVAVVAQQAATPQTLVYSLNVTGQGGRIGPAAQSMSTTLSIAIASSDADGTRHAALKMSKATKPVTISPAGAIAFSPTAVGVLLNAQLRQFNAFAEECAKRMPLVPGMTWHAATPIGSTPMDTIYAVKSGDRKAGRGVMLITIRDASTGGSELKAEGYYDPLDGLVVSMHYEFHTPNNPESEVFDIGLVNS